MSKYISILALTLTMVLQSGCSSPTKAVSVVSSPAPVTPVKVPSKERFAIDLAENSIDNLIPYDPDSVVSLNSTFGRGGKSVTKVDTATFSTIGISPAERKPLRIGIFGFSQNLEWKSSDAQTATVQGNGSTAIVDFLKDGTVTIMVYSNSNKVFSVLVRANTFQGDTFGIVKNGATWEVAALRTNEDGEPVDIYGETTKIQSKQGSKAQ